MKLNFPISDEIAPCYAELVAALRVRGFQPYMNDRTTLMVARRRPAMPDDGNCFYIIFADGWFLKPMGESTYRMPGKEPPIDLCVELLGFESVLGDVPDEITNRFRLSLLDTVQLERLEAQIANAESLLPPSIDFGTFVAEMRDRNLKVDCTAGVHACCVTGTVANSRLWFVLYSNHWFVATVAGVVYACWDEQVVGLCTYALRNEPPILESFPDNFVRGYFLRQLPEGEKRVVLEYAGL
jgi:hypothetical protein